MFRVMPFFLIIVALLVGLHRAGAVEVQINPGLPLYPDLKDKSIPGVVEGFYRFALMAGGLLAFGAIVYGAARYTLAAGNPSGQSDAKDQITQALLGLLLLLGVYLVLFTINPNLTKLSLPNLVALQIEEETLVPPERGATPDKAECERNCKPTDKKECVLNTGTRNWECRNKPTANETYGCQGLDYPKWHCADTAEACYALVGGEGKPCKTSYSPCQVISKSYCQ